LHISWRRASKTDVARHHNRLAKNKDGEWVESQGPAAGTAKKEGEPQVRGPRDEGTAVPCRQCRWQRQRGRSFSLFHLPFLGGFALLQL